MKNILDLKTMLLATLACVVYTGIEFFQEQLSPVHWYSPKDFKVLLFWAVMIIAWIVYFLQKHKNK